jgi:heterodisulfide reductase subunit A
MIQCVGSRDEEHPYCSRVCCTQALKNALRFKEAHPEGEVTVFYRDVRTYGLRESLYTDAREAGVRFIRYEPEAKPVVSNEGGVLTVTAHDPVLRGDVKVEVDTLVLAPPIVPAADAGNLAQMLKVPLNADGFFLEAHMKLRPIDFATDGIYLCGMAHSPKWLDESVSQALGAAARAATLLSKDELDLEATISEVIDANCDGCAYCIDPCPYNALTLIEYVRGDQIKKTVQNNPALCKGCGVCMATCPKLGIFVRHYKPEQLAAMVEAALEPV